MSRGIGALQKRILAAMQDDQTGVAMCATRTLVVRFLVEDHNGDVAMMTKHLWSMDRAVRRALRGLEARGLVIDTGRVSRTPYARRAVQSYADPKTARFMDEALATVPADFFDRARKTRAGGSSPP